MNKLYSKFTEVSFKRLTILLCFLGDLAVIRFLYVKMSDQTTIQKMINVFTSITQKQLGSQYGNFEFPPDFIEELYQLTMMVTGTMFIILIFIHIIIYLLHLKNFKFAHDYIRLICLIGAPGSLLVVIPTLGTPILSLYFAALSLAYFFLIIGFQKFSYSKSQG